MCTVLLATGVNPTAVNKHVISYCYVYVFLLLCFVFLLLCYVFLLLCILIVMLCILIAMLCILIVMYSYCYVMYSYCYVVCLLLCIIIVMLCILIIMFCILIVMLCVLIAMYSYYSVYVFLLLCMFRSVYSVSLCRSVCCLCVNVYCTAATGCQPNCSYKYSISYAKI